MLGILLFAANTLLLPALKGAQPVPASVSDDELLLNYAIAKQFHRHDALVRRRLVRDMTFLYGETDGTEQELFDQAVQLELHRNDQVVVRRLLQQVELQIKNQVRLPEPEEVELRRLYKAYYQEPDIQRDTRLGFSQVFIAAENNNDAVKRLQQLRENAVPATEAMRYSDVFVRGYHFSLLSLQQVTNQFGREFAAALMEVDLQQWSGPVPSAYGTHLVFLEIREQSQPSFAEVRSLLEEQVVVERQQQALQTLLADLRQGKRP